MKSGFQKSILILFSIVFTLTFPAAAGLTMEPGKYSTTQYCNLYITDVEFINPPVCGGTGSIVISVLNGTPGETYAIDLDRDNTTDAELTLVNDRLTLTGIPAGTMITGIRIISEDPDCSAVDDGYHLFVGPSNLVIGNIIVRPVCNSGSTLIIPLNNVPNGGVFSADLNNDGVFEYTNLVLENGELTIENVSPGTYISTLNILDNDTYCSKTRIINRLITTTLELVISNILIVNPNTCGGSGTLIITLESYDENDIDFDIDFNSDGIIDANVSRNGNQLEVPGIRTGTIINSPTITALSSGCIASNGITGTITDPSPYSIQNVSYVDPLNCDEKGQIYISILGGTEGSTYTVDFQNDGVPELNLSLEDEVLFSDDIDAGTRISNLVVTEINSGCTAGYIGSHRYTAPEKPEVSISALTPVCQNTLPYEISGGDPVGGTYSINGEVISNFDPQQYGIGTHQVIYSYTNVDNCTGSDTALLTVHPLPVVFISGQREICQNTSGLIYSTDYNSNYLYLWNIRGGEISTQIDSSAIIVNWLAEEESVVSVRVEHMITGCYNSDEFDVIFSDVEPPVLQNCAPRIELTATVDENGPYYEFQNADTILIPSVRDNCSNIPPILEFSLSSGNELPVNQLVGQQIRYGDAGTLRWRAIDGNGNSSECTTQLVFTFEEEKNYAISPNGDDKNDVWQMPFLTNHPDCTVKVFDRNGRLVFSSGQGYTEPWDGKYNGELLPMDSYYYVISLDAQSDQIFGLITIIY